MAAVNRWDHWIEKLEDILDTISGLNILTKFELNKYQEYEFPYAYVELAPDLIDYPYENKYDINGNQDFTIWCGVETSTDGDIRGAQSLINQDIELAFRDVDIIQLSTLDFTLNTISLKITGIYPVPNYETTKHLFIVTGTIKYEQLWD